MTVASDNADDLTAGQLERGKRLVAKLRRAAFREAMGEPPMTPAAAVAAWDALQAGRRAES
jgi:hypothetical protein